MADILARYQQLKDEGQVAEGVFLLTLQNGHIALQYTRESLTCGSTIFCLFLLGLDFFLYKAWLPHHLRFIAWVLVPVILAWAARSLWTVFAHTPSLCEIDPQNRHLTIYRWRQKIELALNDITCFLCVFTWHYDRGNREPVCRIYVVSNRNVMYQLIEDNVYQDDTGRKILSAIADLCEKPVYFTERGMSTSEFIFDMPPGKVFDRQDFLAAKAAYHPENTNK